MGSTDLIPGKVFSAPQRVQSALLMRSVCPRSSIFIRGGRTAVRFCATASETIATAARRASIESSSGRLEMSFLRVTDDV
jgi:hypothetical protein